VEAGFDDRHAPESDRADRIERFAVRRALLVMDAQDLLPHRTALIGAAVALTIGVAGGLILKTGSQTAPEAYADFMPGAPMEQVDQIAWPSGKLPDYVVGTDFLKAQQPYQPPVVVAAYEVPEYKPEAWEESSAPAEVQPVRTAQTDERAWPSTQGDILDIRLPEDAPQAPEPPVVAAAPVALAAASY
jgi:hypothetical protein